MAFNWKSPRIVSVLPLIAIGLALVNWNAKPGEAWAWAASIVMSVIMVAVHRRSRLALTRSPGDPALVRSVDSINGAVAFGSLIMIIPLALPLAHAYGFVDDPRNWMLRMTMVLAGAYLAVTGNAMPRMLPPTVSLPSGGAHVQAFQRRAGWTWVLCGLGFAITWLAVPIDVAGLISMSLIAVAIILTIVQLQRLRKPRAQAPRLN